MLVAFLARAAVAVLCWAIPAHRTRQLLLSGGEGSLGASSSAARPLSRSQLARQRRRYLAYWVCVAAFCLAERLLWTPRHPRVPHAAAAVAAAAAHVALTVALLHPSSGLCLRLVDTVEAAAAARASSSPAAAQTVPVPVTPPPRLFSTEASLCRYCSPPASPQGAGGGGGGGSSSAAQEARLAQATVAALRAERDRAVAARVESLATVAAVRRRNEELSQALEEARKQQSQPVPAPAASAGAGSASPTALETELQAEVLHLRRLLASRSLSELRQDAFESAAGGGDTALSWSSASPRRLRASAGCRRAPDEIHVACPDNAWVSGTYTLDGPVEGGEGPLRRGTPRWSCGEKTAEESAGGWLIRGRGGGGGDVEHELLREEGGGEAPLAPSSGLSARVLVNRRWTACTLRNLR